MKSIPENIAKLTYLILLSLLNSLYTSTIKAQQLYPASFDINTLKGTNGFAIPGIDPESQFGAETKFIGDINNDGFEDIGIGVNNADINGLDLAGAAYIIFGTNAGLPPNFDITTLNGANGFVVEGKDRSKRMGGSIEGVGDINGDTIDDLVVVYSGGTMVIYGKATPFNATYTVDYADGVNGFLIQGSANEAGALGDVNGDTINDFILSRAGGVAQIYFGRSTNFPAIINASWLDGIKGFSIKRYSNSSIPGYLAGGAGDINNDGINDINLGDWKSGTGARTHLIYGRNSFPSVLDVETMSITEGFTVDHSGGNFLAFTGSLGDINHDGIDDFFSERAAIFGKSLTDPFPSHIPLSSIHDGTYGFVLPGTLTSASIGDINQDGINDFISVYGGSGSDRNAYVIFGSTTGFPNPIDETTLNGMNGFIVPGFKTSNIGRPISGGDFNNDGISDFIIGSPNEVLSGSGLRTGEAYVILGGDHYAIPLNDTYPQVNNETTSGFTITVNGPETGTIHYAIFLSTFSTSVTHDIITGGTGAITNGSFLMNTANTSIDEVISSLSEDTTYDIYIFLEDGSGNQGVIEKIDNAKTLSSGDTTPPTITCPGNQEVPCHTHEVPDFTSLVTVTDAIDPSPTVTQSPAAGTRFTDGMTITMTATDSSSNSSTCTFILNRGADTEKPVITCLTSESLFVNATLPNYFLKLTVSDSCTSIFDFTYTQTPAQGTVFTSDTNVIVTVTDGAGNSESCSFLVTTRPSPPPIDCTTASLNLNDLNGSNGFTIEGDRIKGETGYDVRNAGDVNGDGIQDFLVGSPGKAYRMNTLRGIERGNFPGDVFVVFGKRGNFLPNLDTKLLNGTNGFKITNDIPGGTFQFSGYQVSTAGDINNDGIDDLMFSDPFRRHALGSEMGETYIIFGKRSAFPPVFNVSDIDGTNGFVFLGGAAFDQSALSIDSAGDINNDGINDIIIGARSARWTDTTGKCYIVYGSSNPFPALLKAVDLNGTNGFTIKGNADGEAIGNFVAGLGDVNGDGIDDLGFQGGRTNKTFILFGKTGNHPRTISTGEINGTNGFYVDVSSFTSNRYKTLINGVGDINNDGINDILFGNSYLFFGKNTPFSAEEDITTLNGTNGFKVSSTPTVASSGGDFNNDGIDDLLLGTYGRSVIVFGKNTPWNATISPYSLPPSEAFIIRSSLREYPLANLGDINGDGITDIIIGEKERLYYDSSSSLDPGHAYVIYGFSVPDTEAPVITCPSDQILASGNLLPDYTSLATVSDNCDVNPIVTQSPTAGSTYTPGMTITLIATDVKGNTNDCTFVVNEIVDSVPPTASNPLSLSFQCSSDVPTPDPLVVTDEADDSMITPTVTFISDVSDGASNPESITRTYRVTDQAGNHTDVQQTIIVNDTINPTASNPPNVTVACSSDIPAADITIVNDETDNCTANPTVTFISNVSDGASNPETITRTYRVTDEAGNFIDVIQTIIVNDTINPTASNPPNVTVACSSDIPAADITVVTDETDNCTANPTVTFISNVSDGASNPETITRTYRVTDEAGNFIDVTQTIIVNDTINPTASNPSNIAVACSSDIPAVDITVVTDETDNCTANPTVTFVSDVSDGASNPETITRTYRVTDEGGNFIDVIQTIIVNDTINPTASNPPNQTVACSSDIPAADITVVTDETDNCTANPTVTFISDVSDGASNPETIVRTYRVTDQAGNFIDVIQIIIVNDTINPTASNPSNIAVACSSDIPAADITIVNDEADNCTANPTVTFVSDVSDGASNPETIVRTYRVADQAGNFIDITQTIVIIDTADPTASNPPNITVVCSSDIPIPDTTVITDEADNCTANPTVTFISDISDGVRNPETITRTYRVTDQTGNYIDITQTIVIMDTVNPTASNPSNITVVCSSDIPAADTTVVTDEADNCTVNPTVTFINEISNGASNPETITRTYRVTDEAENFIDVTQTIIVNDTINPTASNPPNITVACSSDVPAADITVVTDEADNCTVNPTVTFTSDVSDGASNPETITRTYRVTDEAGNFIDVTQTIIVNDTINPTASNLPNITLVCSDDIPAADITVVNDEADNCTRNPTVTFISDVSDGASRSETITRTYRVTDEAGNFIDVTQTIIVNDTINPTASNPPNITVVCSDDVPAADITVVTDEADNCTGNPTVTFISDVSDGASRSETITRTYRIADEAGNFIDVTQTIIVNDTINPTASNLPNITVVCSDHVPAADISLINDATDNCTTNPTVTFISDVSDGASNPEIITRTYRVTDQAENQIDITQTITVQDSINPTASNPPNITITCSSDIPAADISLINDATDNCTTNPTVTFISDVSDGASNPETITRIYRVTDQAGNLINVTQTIIVQDSINPTASNPPNITVTCSSDIPPADISLINDATDNCTTNPTVTFISDVSDGASNSETIIRTYRVTDQSGNHIDVTQTIIVNDNIAPEIECPNDIVQNVEGGLSTAIVHYNSPVATDNCSTTTINQIAGLSSGSEFPIGTTIITFEATDLKGNTSTCSFNITIEDVNPFKDKYGFSPDDDGINEYWEIPGIENYPKNKVFIYNRWGDLVFEISDYNNSSNVFGGTANKKRSLGADELPEGTYFFQIKIDNPQHQKEQTGFLVLKR
ncbi:gliding motility-associated C-terminal domain-containing protein [Tenacibaculum sp. MAR_2009_124]|uniref:HYR-like domain-containing protein n=1 Tax=Tenacibaculum sp. MAR_2009_124 TaxID=1250059 RepID=UPI00089672D1|nr:HYR domain-containing protein [Tenacibaculum sp. MAR_2009_124]SED16571.1 gliding motility-associated C-terminal domain-containing protein [Tenacibaculum sp. MAR_2009_124]